MEKEIKEEVFRFADKSNAIHLTLFPAMLDHYNGGEEGIVKSVIKDFCRDAHKILEKAGIQISQNKNVKRDYFASYLAGEKDILLSNALRVIASANDCCVAIENGNAENAAIEMMRLCFAITSMAMREVIIQGIATKTGQPTGGTKSRKLKGIEAAIKERLQKKAYTAGELWGYFRKFTEPQPLIIGEYEVCMKGDHADDKNPEKLYEESSGKIASITFAAFRRYVAETKTGLEFEKIINEILLINPNMSEKELEMLRSSLTIPK